MSDMRYWLLHSSLSPQSLASEFGTPRWVGESAIEVSYGSDGIDGYAKFGVEWKFLPYESTLLGGVAQTHNLHATVLFDDWVVPAGKVHASLTADLIEHPDVFAGVFCDPDLMAFVVWSETVEMAFPVVEREGASSEFVSYIQPFVDRHLASVSVPLEAELTERGIGYTWRDVPLTDI